MLTKSIGPMFLICLSFIQPTPADKAKKDLELMQGKWTMHALEINGKDEPAKRLQDTTLTIKKDDYRTTVKKKEQPTGFRIKLDPSKDPKQIDMIQAQPDGSEKIYKGIYVFEKDTMKICRGINPEQERPNQFATWPDTGYFVVTWKKE